VATGAGDDPQAPHGQMLRRHGQQLQPVDVAVSTDTASKLNARFMISVSSRKQSGKNCLGSLRRMPMQTSRGGVSILQHCVPSRQLAVLVTENCGKIGWFGCSCQVAERRVAKLYITRSDVQTQRLNFFNIRFRRVLKTWYTFRKLRNRIGRWIEEPLRTRFT
jgi:hypothetical protein